MTRGLQFLSFVFGFTTVAAAFAPWAIAQDAAPLTWTPTSERVVERPSTRNKKKTPAAGAAKPQAVAAPAAQPIQATAPASTSTTTLAARDGSSRNAAPPAGAVSPPSLAASAVSQKFCENIADAAADARFAAQKAEMARLEEGLRSRVRKLEDKRAEFETWLARRDAFIRKAEDSIVRLYSRVKPEVGAAQLAALDEEAAAAVLMKLNERRASALLDQMDAEKAARLIGILVGAAQKRTEQATPVLPVAASGAENTETQEPKSMKHVRNGLMAFATMALGGCTSAIQDFAREPQLTPIGSGLAPSRIESATVPAPKPTQAVGTSFWRDGAGDLFRDPRAAKVGDIVTVKISIKDRASLDNSTNSKRNSSRDLDLKLNYSLNTANVNKHLQAKGDGELNPSMSSNTSSKGEGAISRSESIDLLVAAVVTDVLPNGNLLISGKQEVRVNSEVRDLGVAGIIRPRDISTENSISYERIAEARISYGGRGRVTEVQQPGWGHRLFDNLSPF